jgi:hypothetical protein
MAPRPHSGVRKASPDLTSQSSAAPAKKARVVGGLPAVKTSLEAGRPHVFSGHSPSRGKSPVVRESVADAPGVFAPAQTLSSVVSQPQIGSSSSQRDPDTLTTPHLPNISTGLTSNPQKSALPPISRLLSQVPLSGRGEWEGVPSHRSLQSRNGSERPQHAIQEEASFRSHHPYYSPHAQHRDAHPASAPLPRSRSPYATGWPSYQPGGLPSAQMEDKPSTWTAGKPDLALSRTHMSILHSSIPGSLAPVNATNSSGRSFDKRSAASTSPTAPFHTSITRSSTPASHLGRLDRTAILSLDTPALRSALFATPAFKTFALLPSSALETGLGDFQELIKVAYQLANSTALIQVSNDAQWQVDVADTVGQCMMPTLYTKAGPHRLCREIETLLLCYFDAMRRGRYLSGILGCISGKVSDIQARGVNCSRYKASLTLLSVW